MADLETFGIFSMTVFVAILIVTGIALTVYLVRCAKQVDKVPAESVARGAAPGISSGEAAPLDDFYEVGSLQPSEARRIVRRLTEEKVRFEVEADDDGIKRMDAVTASLGSSWGNAALVRLFVHRGDERIVRKVLAEFFKS